MMRPASQMPPDPPPRLIPESVDIVDTQRVLESGRGGPHPKNVGSGLTAHCADRPANQEDESHL